VNFNRADTSKRSRRSWLCLDLDHGAKEMNLPECIAVAVLAVGLLLACRFAGDGIDSLFMGRKPRR
jgi:hypothetical protein